MNKVDPSGHKAKFLRNKKLLKGQNIKLTTRLKALYTAQKCLRIIDKYDKEIEWAAKKFDLPSDMIRSVLYREIMCMGVDDIIADFAVLNYYDKSIISHSIHSESIIITHLKREESSTGLGQIFPSTAIAAESNVLKYNTTTDLWTMWSRLQDETTNIYYCAMVLRMEANKLGYGAIKKKNYNKIKKVLGKYNGNPAYRKAVLDNYKEFIKG